MNRRDFLLGLGLAPFATRTASAATPLTIGHLYAQDFDPVFVALDQDFFTRHGIAAKSISLAGAQMVPPALISGSAQIGSASPVLLLQANEAGLDLVTIAGVSRESAKHPAISVIARSDAGIKTPADLVGKKVGVVGIGTSFWLFAQSWLTRNGVAPDKVTFIEVMSPRTADALRSKTIDATCIFNPFRDRILNEGLGINLGDYWVQLQDNIMTSSWLTTRAWAEANHDAIVGFRGALREAMDWIPRHVPETKAIEAKVAGNSWPGFPDFTLDISAADMEIYAREAVRYGLISKIPDLQKLIVI